MILNAPLLFLLVNLATSKKFNLPLEIVPRLVRFTVCRGTTFCVNTRPATLIVIPERNEGRIFKEFLE